MSDTDTNNAQLYTPPGFEDTNFMEIEDSEGTEYYAAKEEIPVGTLVIIIFVVGTAVAFLLFFFLYWKAKKRREEEEAAKLAGVSASMSHPRSSRDLVSSVVSPTSTATSNTSWGAAAADGNGDARKKEIEEGLIVHTWMVNVHPEEEKSEDEEAPNNNNPTKNACPICRKPFQTGEEICSSRNQSCGHTFHKTCMFNWLQYQNRCPVCNEEYLEAAPATLS